MKKVTKTDLRQRNQPINFDDDEAVDDAISTAVRGALQEHKRLGQSVAIWQDGKVVTVAAEDIPVDLMDAEVPNEE